MAERDDPEKLSYMNNSGECRFCDEKNLEWRFAVITCHMSAQTMLVLTILVIMVATEEDQKMINMYNCEESYKNESSC